MLACFSLRENVFISGGSSLVPQLFSLGWPVTVFETVVVVAVLTVVTYDQVSRKKIVRRTNLTNHNTLLPSLKLLLLLLFGMGQCLALLGSLL